MNINRYYFDMHKETLIAVISMQQRDAQLSEIQEQVNNLQVCWMYTAVYETVTLPMHYCSL